jgi:hypothetical protein
MGLRDLSSGLFHNLSAPKASASHMTGKLWAAAALYSSRSGCSFEISSSPVNATYHIVTTSEQQELHLLGFGFCSLSGILETKKHSVSETGFVFVLR